MKVVTLKKTCNAIPAQWEGKTDDNRSVYVRYRWGYLSVQVSEPGGSVEDAVEGDDEVFGKQIGDNLDGWLSYDQLKEATPTIQWPVREL